jgi:hypothetical protein
LHQFKSFLPRNSSLQTGNVRGALVDFKLVLHTSNPGNPSNTVEQLSFFGRKDRPGQRDPSMFGGNLKRARMRNHAAKSCSDPLGKQSVGNFLVSPEPFSFSDNSFVPIAEVTSRLAN